MLSKLNDREKIFVLVGSVLVLVFLLFIAIRSLSAYKINLLKKIQDTEKNVNEIKSLAVKYKKLKGKKLKITLNPDNVLPEVENLLKQNTIREQATSLTDSKETMKKEKYTKTLVKIRLHTVPFASLSKFIYDIEDNQNYWLKIEYCRLRKVPNKPGMYDANIRIASYFSKK